LIYLLIYRAATGYSKLTHIQWTKMIKVPVNEYGTDTDTEFYYTLVAISRIAE